MKNHLLIIFLLAFASLSNSSTYIPKLTVPYELSNKQVDTLNKIIINKEETAAAYSKGIKDLFEIFFNPKAKTDDFKVFDSPDGIKEAIDLPFDAVLIVFKKSNRRIVEEARNASYKYLRDAAVAVTVAFELSQSKNYLENQSTIQIYKENVKKNLINLVKSFYDSIRISLNTKDSDILAVIKKAQEGSTLGLTHLTNAIFNAIKIRALSITSKLCNNRNFISDMEEFEEKALKGVEDDVDYKISLLKTLYIYPYLNTSGIIAELFLIQYAVTVAYETCKDGNDVSFNTVTRYLERINREIDDDGEVIFSRLDIASAKALALYNAADYANLAAIMSIYPNSISTILTSQEKIIGANVAGGAAYFNSIYEAANLQGANYTQVKENVDALRKLVVDLAPHYTAEYFTVIHNNQTFDNETESKLNILLNFIIHGAVYATNTFLDSVDILAYATHVGKVTEDNFNAVRILLNESNFAVAEYHQGVSAMSLVVLLANNKK